jgi:hypothetical protein
MPIPKTSLADAPAPAAMTPAHGLPDRAVEMLGKLQIENPLVVSDKDSMLTVNAGGGVAVDLYVEVPKTIGRNPGHDGVLVELHNIKPETVVIEGEVGQKKSIPARTPEGAFAFHVSKHGAIKIGNQVYNRTDRVRETGEIVLSGIRFDTMSGVPGVVQKRIKPMGTELVPPPAVELLGFSDAQYQPGPGMIAAQGKGGILKPGTSLHITGESIERLETEVSSIVEPKTANGWSDPAGIDVVMTTTLRVKNVDIEAIYHEDMVLRSSDTRRYGNDDGRTTRHYTELKGVNLSIAPGEVEEVRVEQQSGKAHIEYRVSDTIANRDDGAGSNNANSTAERVVVLDSTAGKRHAGKVRFMDGAAVMAEAEAETASPARSRLSTEAGGSGVMLAAETTWSEPTGSDEKRNQDVTKKYTISNISAVAGQLKLAAEVEGFRKSTVKINGKKIDKVLSGEGFKAVLSSRSGGGAQLEITVDVAAGSEQAPSARELRVEVAGEYRNEPQ